MDELEMEMEASTSLEWDKKMLDTLLNRLVRVDEGLSIVLGSVMGLYQDHMRHKDMYEYGPGDTASAYAAVSELMDAGTALSMFRSHVDNAKSILECMSGDLYLEREAKEADMEGPDEE